VTSDSNVTGAPAEGVRELGPRDKWIALSNTTLGVLMATINQSIVLIRGELDEPAQRAARPQSVE
jgi:hypothetical protein